MGAEHFEEWLQFRIASGMSLRSGKLDCVPFAPTLIDATLTALVAEDSTVKPVAKK